MGDALLGVFGIPRVHEDDALRAVRAAAEAREAITALGEELERERGVLVNTRTGVSTGEVMSAGRLPVSGEPVALAGRLAQSAPPAGVVLDAATERLVLNAVRVKPVGKQAAGGQAAAWLLSEVLEGAPAFARRLDAPIVGRQTELAQLRQAFDAAVRDASSFLFTVLGPAGIGKSRLARELRSSLEDEAIVVTGRCLPYGKGITFWPLAEVVGQLAGGDTKAGIADLLGDEPDAGRVADRIAGALGTADPAVGTEETFWAVRKLLENLAQRRPVVVVFDDIHWAEPTFLDLVEHVADLSRSSPILLLCLARPELLEERPAWGGGKLNASSILLGPLSERESADLLEQLRGRAPVDERLRAQLFEAAEGNPLFIEQMLAMLAEDDRSADQLAIPPTIQALLAARLDRLEVSERAVLEQAAVVGKEFWAEALAELLPDETGATALLQALVRKDLIRPAASSFGGTEGFRFRHQLIRDAAYESLPKQARAESHERLAAWLERAGELAREYEEIVGYHLEQAFGYRAELGLVDERALAIAVRAAERLAAPGRRAFNRGDLPAAVNLLSRAAALTPDGSLARADLLADLGEALRDAGDLQRADRTLGEAIEQASALGEEALEWRTRMVRLRMQNQLDPEFTAQDLESVAERGRTVLTRYGDDGGLARAWWMLAWGTWLRCRASDAEAALRHAIEHARRAGAWRVEAHALNLLLGAGLFGPLPVDDAIRRCEHVLAEPNEQQRIEASACRALAVLRAMKGEFDEARALVARDRAILEELGLGFQAAAAAEGYGMVELLAGDVEAAERELGRGYERLTGMGESPALANVTAILAQALYGAGRYSQALRFSEISQEAAAEDDLSAQILWRGPRAKVLARRGRSKTAETLAGDAVALAAQTDFLNQRGDALLDLAEVRRLDGRMTDARAAAEDAVTLYEAKGNIVSASRAKVLLKALGAPDRRARRAAAGGARPAGS
jgi:AAA ATPase-like protein